MEEERRGVSKKGKRVLRSRVRGFPTESRADGVSNVGDGWVAL